MSYIVILGRHGIEMYDPFPSVIGKRVFTEIGEIVSLSISYLLDDSVHFHFIETKKEVIS